MLYDFSRQPPWFHFSAFYVDVLQESVDPFKSQWAPKWHPKSTKWHQNIENRDQWMLQNRIPENAQTLRNAGCIGTFFSFLSTHSNLIHPSRLPPWVASPDIYNVHHFHVFGLGGHVCSFQFERYSGSKVHVFAAAPKTLRITKRIAPSKSNGAQSGTPNWGNGAKASKVEISTLSKTWSWNNPAPEMPPEALLITCFMIVEESWYLSDFMSNDFKWLLAPLLAFSSGFRQKRRTPGTMQNTCSELIRKF